MTRRHRPAVQLAVALGLVWLGGASLPACGRDEPPAAPSADTPAPAARPPADPPAPATEPARRARMETLPADLAGFVALDVAALLDDAARAGLAEPLAPLLAASTSAELKGFGAQLDWVAAIWTAAPAPDPAECVRAVEHVLAVSRRSGFTARDGTGAAARKRMIDVCRTTNTPAQVRCMLAAKVVQDLSPCGKLPYRADAAEDGVLLAGRFDAPRVARHLAVKPPRTALPLDSSTLVIAPPRLADLVKRAHGGSGRLGADPVTGPLLGRVAPDAAVVAAILEVEGAPPDLRGAILGIAAERPLPVRLHVAGGAATRRLVEEQLATTRRELAARSPELTAQLHARLPFLAPTQLDTLLAAAQELASSARLTTVDGGVELAGTTAFDLRRFASDGVGSALPRAVGALMGAEAAP